MEGDNGLVMRGDEVAGERFAAGTVLVQTFGEFTEWLDKVASLGEDLGVLGRNVVALRRPERRGLGGIEKNREVKKNGDAHPY